MSSLFFSQFQVEDLTLTDIYKLQLFLFYHYFSLYLSRTILTMEFRELRYLETDYYDCLSDDDKNDIKKFRKVKNWINQKIKKIERLKHEIKTTQDSLRKYKILQTNLFIDLRVLTEKYKPIIIIKNTKGKYVYWNLNVRYYDKPKSIYLGSDYEIRKYLKSKFPKKVNLNENFIRDNLKSIIIPELDVLIKKHGSKFRTEKILREQILK